uniref:Uncharacterized protein n=1 Tax=Solanum tuberosum TaxID=4113 RepID=M1DBP8_SOLTU
MCSEGSFGEVSENRRCIRRSSLWSISSPFISCLQHLCVLGLSTLEQQAYMRSVGDPPNVFGDSQTFISLFFRLLFAPFSQVVSMLCLKL